MAASLPVVRIVGPGRNVGKTWLASRLIRAFDERGYLVGAVKRTHHPVIEDREGSDTALFARAGAAAVVLGGHNGTLTRGPASTALQPLVAPLAGAADLVVVEGFKDDTLGARVEIVSGAPTHVRVVTMDGRLALTATIDEVDLIARTLECVLGITPLGDRAVREGVRRASVAHGHRCPGLTLGVRMTLYAARLLDIDLESSDEASPDRAWSLRELSVQVETARCATDAIAALTGCTIGSRRLRVVEYGKLAATFEYRGRPLRIAARPGLRAVTSVKPACGEPRHTQDQAYRTMTNAALFTVREGTILADLVPSQRGQIACAGCGEEVAVASARPTDAGPCCVPCASAAPVPAIR